MGPFLPPGRPKAKSAPLGGSKLRSGAAWGPFLPPGRPKAKSAPLGGSKLRSSAAWGPFLPPGRPKAKSAPLGGQQAALAVQRGGLSHAYPACFAPIRPHIQGGKPPSPGAMPGSGAAGPGFLVGKYCQKRLKSRVGKMFFRLGRLVCGGFAAARILPRALLPTMRWRRPGVRPTFLGFSRAYLCLSMQCLRTCARRTAENVRPCFNGLPRMRAKHVPKTGYRGRLPAQGLGLVRYRFSRQGRLVHGCRRFVEPQL